MGKVRYSWSRRRRRHHPQPNPALEELQLEEVVGHGSGRRWRGRGRWSPGLLLASLRLSHLAFLLLGMALGAGALSATLALVNRERPRAEAKEAGPEAKAPPPARPAAAPAPVRIVASDDPTTVVREMLRASFRGDTATAYAYWAIAPREVAFHGAQGDQASLQEFVRKLAGRSGLDGVTFRLRELGRNAAEVGLYSGQARAQRYTLARSEGTWRITSVAAP